MKTLLFILVLSTYPVFAFDTTWQSLTPGEIEYRMEFIKDSVVVGSRSINPETGEVFCQQNRCSFSKSGDSVKVECLVDTFTFVITEGDELYKGEGFRMLKPINVKKTVDWSIQRYYAPVPKDFLHKWNQWNCSQ